MHKVVRHIFLTVVTLLSMGCLRQDEVFSTDIIITPYEQTTSDDEYMLLDGTVAYLFDSSNITIASYEEALQGVARNATTDEQVMAIGSSTPYSGDVVSSNSITLHIEGREYAMLMVVDKKNEIWALCNYEVGVNLPTTYIELLFRPWKEGESTAGDWTYYAPELTTEPTEE